MTERKCACNKLFLILVRGPNKEADEKSAYDNVQFGVWAPTQRNWNRNFYKQCKLGWDDEINFAKISFLSHSPEKFKILYVGLLC
ncbi:hypothetical protein CD170_10315 [Staphylococcus aureus]|nr:hypothetical protein CD170_10315 [Staphylococcus aureus]